MECSLSEVFRWGVLFAPNTPTHTRGAWRLPQVPHSIAAQGVPLQHPGGVISCRTRTPHSSETHGSRSNLAVYLGTRGWRTCEMVLRVGRQRGLGWALVEQSSMENWVCDGGVRRLHRGAERHRRGTRCGAVALAMVMEPDATCRRAEDVAEVRHASSATTAAAHLTSILTSSATAPLAGLHSKRLWLG